MIRVQNTIKRTPYHYFVISVWCKCRIDENLNFNLFSYLSAEITNEIILVYNKYTYEYNRKFGSLYIIQTLNINISGHNIRRYTYRKTREI